jgi:ATP-binding cassette subfamily C protein
VPLVTPQIHLESNFRRVGGFAAELAARSGWGAALALGFLLLGSFTEGASVLLLVPVLSMLTSQHGQFSHLLPKTLRFAEFTNFKVDFNVALGGFLFILCARAALMRWKDIFMAKVFYDFINQLRNDLFSSIANARWIFLSRTRVADLDHALTADIDRVQTLTVQLLMLVQAVVLLAVYGVASLFISYPMTLGAAVLGAATMAVLRPVRRRASAYGRVLTSQRQEQYRTVSEFLGGVKVAKSFNVEATFIHRLADILARMETEFMSYQRVNSLSPLLFQISSAVGIALFVWAGLQIFKLSAAHVSRSFRLCFRMSC